MLGADDSRTVASMDGVSGTASGWLAGALGLLMLAVGVLAGAATATIASVSAREH